MTQQIAFLGNERHLFHAFRAMTRYAKFAGTAPYTFLLFGGFPQEMLRDQLFHFQCIGETREDLESFQEDYTLVLDPERNFAPGGIYALSQWFEAQLGLTPHDKSAPFFVSSHHALIRAIKYRLHAQRLPVGNTIFLMPPSPQDPEWPQLPSFTGTWWEEAIDLIDRLEYSMVYPQVVFHGNVRFDYRFFFTGCEDTFTTRCYMPTCQTFQEVVYHLSQCKLYLGCDNLFADIAAAMHIPTIVIHPKERRGSLEVFSVRQDEYLFHPIYFTHALRWNHDALRQALHYLEGLFIPFSRPLGEYDRIRRVLGSH